MTTLNVASMLGVDTLIVSIPLGMLGISATQRYQLAAMVAACDTIALLLGAVLWSTLPDLSSGWAPEVRPFLLSLDGIYALILLRFGRSQTLDGATLLFIAIIFSIDDFLAGCLSGGSSVSCGAWACITGAVSGASALVGCCFGSMLGDRRSFGNFVGVSKVVKPA